MKLSQILIISVVIVAIVIAMSPRNPQVSRPAGGPSAIQPPAGFACADQAALANIAASRVVARGLRNPDSTRWDDRERRASMLTLEPCVWKTSGFGRSENGFGGMNRIVFTATVTFAQNGSYAVSDVEVAEE